MHTETVYYNAPIGILEIQGTSDCIHSIRFVNSIKGKKMDETAIKFTLPIQKAVQDCSNQLDEYFSGTRTVFELPTEQSGTNFQQQVWSSLKLIPYGQTISYLTLSKRLNNVKAIRAVGSANGQNAICIVIPCHRVIGANGDLVGYGGDLWRKKWLLDHEAKYAHGVQVLF